jgi:hypothetical protein
MLGTARLNFSRTEAGMTIGVNPVNLGDWRTALDASERRVLKTAAGGDIVLTHATGARMVATWTLVPAPLDPARHLETAHARARQHLARLAGHDPGLEVVSVMTEELFDGDFPGQYLRRIKSRQEIA